MASSRAGKIVGGVVVAIVALIVGVFAYLSTIDVNQYKPLIVEEARKATGRELAIAGDLDLSVGFTPAVVANGITFSNAAWGSKPDMATVERVEVEVSLLPLITGNIQVNRFVLVNADVLIERNTDGAFNFEFAPAGGAAEAAPAEDAGGGGLPSIAVNGVSIQNATLTYNDMQAGQTQKVQVTSLTADADSMSSPIALDLKGAYNDNPFSVSGAVGAVSDLTGNDPFDVKLVTEAGGFTVNLDGVIEQPMDGKGIDLAVAVKGDSLAGASKLAGAELPPIGPIDFKTRVTEADGAYTLGNIAAKIGGTDLGGSVTANVAGAKPMITANLSSNLVRLEDFTGPAPKDGAAPAPKADAKAKGDKPAKVFPADPLPLDGLKAVNADAKVSVKLLDTGTIKVDDLNLSVTLKNGVLTVKPLSASLAGGTVSGDVKLDGSSGKTASLVANLDVSKMPVGRLLKEADITPDLTGGSTDATVRFSGRGASVADIMASSNGKLLVVMGEGTLTGRALDIAGGDIFMRALGSLNPAAADSTKLQCGVVNFAIKDGVATADKGIALETSQMMVIGDGDVDLKTEELDIAIKPEAKEGLNIGAGQIAQAVKLGGTLAEPGVGIDALGAAKTAVTVGQAVATGGMSLLLGGVLDRVLQDDDPCGTALGKPTKAKSSGSSSGGASSGGETQPQKKEPSNPVDAIKGLFGN